MKKWTGLLLAAAMLLSVSVVKAEETKSGLQLGKSVGAFFVTKTAGAEDDGVAVGKNLCYRCMNGNRPQVMVFTRSTDANIVALVKKLDAELTKHESKNLRAFVNVLNEDKSAASEEAKKLCKTSKAKNVPFVVPNEAENGPDNYGLNSNVDVTIIVANRGKVGANIAFKSSKDVDVDAVVKKIEKVIK